MSSLSSTKMSRRWDAIRAYILHIIRFVIARLIDTFFSVFYHMKIHMIFFIKIYSSKQSFCSQLAKLLYIVFIVVIPEEQCRLKRESKIKMRSNSCSTSGNANGNGPNGKEDRKSNSSQQVRLEMQFSSNLDKLLFTLYRLLCFNLNKYPVF